MLSRKKGIGGNEVLSAKRIIDHYVRSRLLKTIQRDWYFGVCYRTII
jgi:hypothetical protein